MQRLMKFTSSLRKEKGSSSQGVAEPQAQAQVQAQASQPVSTASAGSSERDASSSALTILGDYGDDEESGEEGERTVEVSKRPKRSEREAEVYHGQLLERDDSDVEEDGLDGWYAGKLKFRKHIDDRYRLGTGRVGGDGRNEDDYVVLDPRQRAR